MGMFVLHFNSTKTKIREWRGKKRHSFEFFTTYIVVREKKKKETKITLSCSEKTEIFIDFHFIYPDL